MKLSGMVLVYAVLGSRDVTSATARTAIDPLQERELKKRKTGGRGSDTKSGKAADPNVDNLAFDYPATARTILGYMGCNNGHHVCGYACYNIVDEDAVDALKNIASEKADEAVYAIPVHFATHVSFGLGICDSDLKCQAKNPADESTYVKDIQFFKDVHTACGGDANPLTEFEVVYGTVKTAIAGIKRMGNVENIMLKNLLDACGSALGFYTVGYAFAYGGEANEVKGVERNNDIIGFPYQFAIAATAATIVAGTVAERTITYANEFVKVTTYCANFLLLTGFVYPVVVLKSEGIDSMVLDSFVGDGMGDSFVGDGTGLVRVHMTGGLTALVAAAILGPRIGIGSFDAGGNELPRTVSFPPHSVALQVLGTFILWVGWYGFNPGSALYTSNSENYVDFDALLAVATCLAANSGNEVPTMLADMILGRMPDIEETEYDAPDYGSAALTAHFAAKFDEISVAVGVGECIEIEKS